MTLSDAERKSLIENYIQKSLATIDQVHFLIENSQFSLAVNRIYYGIYYILSALALKNNFITSKHAQLIGWFNKMFIKENIIDKKYSKLIQKAFDNRMEGDYDVYANFIKDEVEQSFEEMKEVVSEIRKFL